MTPLRIAQVAPLIEAVPPKEYGGTERVVSYLTEQLVAEGHDVTLFASGDSITKARLMPQWPRSLRLDERVVDRLAHHVLMAERVFQSAHQFDLIHYHIDYLHFPFSRRSHIPTVTTLHGRLDLPDLVPVYEEFREMPIISISDAQRTPISWANWQGTVYHGLPRDEFHFLGEPGSYLAFLGRISPEKRADRAIEIAKRVGMELRIAAKVDEADRTYFETAIEPLLKQSGISFEGEVGGAAKDEFLGRARALLFPIDWPEPFGLVMIEAMACGTPVIAFRNGSVPEVLEHGVTGFIVESVDEAVEAVRRIDSLDRGRIREVFEQRFTAERMTGDYVAVYQRICDAARSPFRAA